MCEIAFYFVMELKKPEHLPTGYCSVLLIDLLICMKKVFIGLFRMICNIFVAIPFFVNTKNLILFQRLAASLPPYGQGALIGIFLFCFVSECPEHKRLPAGRLVAEGTVRPDSTTITQLGNHLPH